MDSDSVLPQPKWHRERVGGLWNTMGKLQFQFLVEQGLRPESYLLDVGCGSLRGGLHFIRYLEPAHYFGIDIDPRMFDGAKQELAMAGLTDRAPVLTESARFEVEHFGRHFDFALAQSVFTHIPPASIALCLANVGEVLTTEGKFFATFFEGDAAPHQSIATSIATWRWSHTTLAPSNASRARVA